MGTKIIFTPSINFQHLPVLSVKIASISFFFSSDNHQSHHLVGCYTTGVNSLLIHIFKGFAFFKFITPSQGSDMKNSFGIIFGKFLSSSRLTLSRFTQRILIPLANNVTLLRPSPKRSNHH